MLNSVGSLLSRPDNVPAAVIGQLDGARKRKVSFFALSLHLFCGYQDGPFPKPDSVPSGSLQW